jgi:FimV-like protein
LWGIASVIKPKEARTSQMMLALQRKSPSSFILQNINLLKNNSILNMPSKKEVLSMGLEEAYIDVKRQNRLWIEHNRRRINGK